MQQLPRLILIITILKSISYMIFSSIELELTGVSFMLRSDA